MLTAVVSDVLLRRLASAGRGRGGRGRQLAVRDYAYDGRGRRISKAVTASGDLDRTEYYYYDDQQMIEQRDGSEQTAMQVVFGTEYIDEPVRLDVNTDPATDNDCLDAGGSAFYYYHQDANFNVVALTDSSGDVAQRYLYDAYGTPYVFDTDDTGVASREILDPRLEVTGSVTVYQPFLFTGRFYDFETNLYHYRARTYHPALGRFMQHDPLGYVDGMSMYEYALSDPGYWVDPFGLAGGVMDDYEDCEENLRKRNKDTLKKIADTSETAAKVTEEVAEEVAIAVVTAPVGGGIFRWVGRGLGRVGRGIWGLVRGRKAAKAGGVVAKATRMNRADFHKLVRDRGFRYHNTTKGGYVRYDHPDGSRIWVRPDGQVIRLGPKIFPPGGGKGYRPHVDRDGKPVDTHDPDEWIQLLPQGL